MNNGVYFTMADLGRIDLAIRSGWGLAQVRKRVAPVVMQETMTFRIHCFRCRPTSCTP